MLPPERWIPNVVVLCSRMHADLEYYTLHRKPPLVSRPGKEYLSCSIFGVTWRGEKSILGEGAPSCRDFSHFCPRQQKKSDMGRTPSVSSESGKKKGTQDTRWDKRETGLSLDLNLGALNSIRPCLKLLHVYCLTPFSKQRACDFNQCLFWFQYYFGWLIFLTVLIQAKDFLSVQKSFGRRPFPD